MSLFTSRSVPIGMTIPNLITIGRLIIVPLVVVMILDGNWLMAFLLFALAGISILQEQRLWLHSRRMEETLNANSPMVQDYVGGLSQSLGSTPAALGMIAQQVQAQALVMAYADIFWIMAVGTLIVLPLVLFLRPLPKDAAPAAMH